MQASEGVIKYELHHINGKPLADAWVKDILDWFHQCHAVGLIGQDPNRYAGCAYGNISRRVPDLPVDPDESEAIAFAISGTQTGMLENITPAHIALVTRVLEDQNMVFSQGPIRPSSEAMSHAMIYRARPDINAVIHVHSPEIWENAERLGLQATDPSADYGTQEMTQEVTRLLGDNTVIQMGAFSMGGHLDGIIAFGETMEIAGQRCLDLFQRAIQFKT